MPAGRDASDVDELRARLAARLSAYKVPRRFLLLADDAVPLLSSGKLDRARARGALPMPADASTIPALLARRRDDRCASSRPSSATTARSPTPSSTTRAARSAAASSRAGVGKGDRVGLLHAERHRLGDGRARGDARSAPSSSRSARCSGRPSCSRSSRSPRVTHLIAVRAYREPLVPRRARARSRRRSSSASRAASAHPRAAGAARDLDRADELPDARARAEPRRRARRRRAARRRHGHPLHLGQPRRAEGRDPHPRERAARDRVRARGALHRRRRAALHPDAVLLDGRLLRRAALGAARGRDAAHGVDAGAGPHDRASSSASA